MIDGLNKVPMAVYLFVIIGILAAVGILINAEMKSSTDTTSSFSVVNETVTIAAAGVDLAKLSLSAPSSILYTNTSEGVDVNLNSSIIIINTTGVTDGDQAATYTAYLDDAAIEATGVSWEGVYINISYSGTDYNQAGNALLNSTYGIANVTKQMPTVGTVIGVLLIVSAVVGLVGVFSYFRRKDGGVY